jgi:hypothetical protein
MRPPRGPTQQRCRDLSTCKPPSDRETMYECRLPLWDVGPKEVVLELKLNDAGRLASKFADKEKTSVNVSVHLIRREFIRLPHGSTAFI